MKLPVAKSSMVPILGVVVISLFALNFFRWIDLRFFQKLKPIICEEVEVEAERYEHHPRVLLHLNGTEFEFDGEHFELEGVERELNRALRELDRAERRIRIHVDHEHGQHDAHRLRIERLRDHEIKERLERARKQLMKHREALQSGNSFYRFEDEAETHERIIEELRFQSEQEAEEIKERIILRDLRLDLDNGQIHIIQR